MLGPIRIFLEKFSIDLDNSMIKLSLCISVPSLGGGNNVTAPSAQGLQTPDAQQLQTPAGEDLETPS